MDCKLKYEQAYSPLNVSILSILKSPECNVALRLMVFSLYSKSPVLLFYATVISPSINIYFEICAEMVS